MADLVLHLGGEGELAPQGRRTEQPFALRQDAHQLAVGVHLHEAEDALAILVGHPVAGLDLAAGLDVRFERPEPLVVAQARVVVGQVGPLARRQDGIQGQGVGHGWASSAAGTTGGCRPRMKIVRYASATAWRVQRAIGVIPGGDAVQGGEDSAAGHGRISGAVKGPQ